MKTRWLTGAAAGSQFPRIVMRLMDQRIPHSELPMPNEFSYFSPWIVGARPFDPPGDTTACVGLGGLHGRPWFSSSPSPTDAMKVGFPFSN